ncbi:flavodoxin [Alkaliphilus pronyensis]|uniref:Flavodoxin n=1 Tax=Alkaliphilus pronyensis TaxID=1482732 RepID=A0A6I0FE31_9FIRM|nr:flavodoxin domain-containing protein [Alkaliphilus pronyensis]KAB3536040.1 flavodoxin [Alkaliphilus pronyensis]
MKTLIVYSTKYGATEKCAEILAKKLAGEVDCINLKTKNNIDLSTYETVIIGGSIYIGSIQKEVTSFCKDNLKALKNKQLGLYICCMRDEKEALDQLYSSFPQELTEKAKAKEVFGGEFTISKMSFIDRFITKKVAKTNKDTAKYLYDNIERFAELMNK